ncbi:MAG TPA: DUF4389 domain-containing protein [Gemmatimonadales bacterium]|jgi:hypothetical protein
MSDAPVNLEIPYPQEMSRGLLLLKTFFGWLYVGIPMAIVGMVYGMAVSLICIIAWFAILFTGQYPRGMFDFVVGYMRWQTRVHAYFLMLTDTYPGFGGGE